MAAARPANERLDVREVLGREEQRQTAIGRFADQREHARAHRAEVDGHRARGHPQIRIVGPALDKRPVVCRALTGQEAAQHVDRLTHRGERVLLRDAYPAQEVRRTRAQSQVKPPGRKLVERGRAHRDLGQAARVGVDDARSDLYALRGLGDGRQHDPGAAQKQIVADPELCEPKLLGGPGQLDIACDGQIVIEAQAELHRLTTASASISTSASDGTSERTTTRLFAGRMSPNTSPCARATSSQWS